MFVQPGRPVQPGFQSGRGPVHVPYQGLVQSRGYEYVHAHEHLGHDSGRGRLKQEIRGWRAVLCVIVVAAIVSVVAMCALLVRRHWGNASTGQSPAVRGANSWAVDPFVEPVAAAVEALVHTTAAESLGQDATASPSQSVAASTWDQSAARLAAEGTHSQAPGVSALDRSGARPIAEGTRSQSVGVSALHQPAAARHDAAGTAAVGARASSLFCWSVMMATGHEPSLLKMQYSRRISIFACDDFAVYSSQVVQLAFDHPFSTSAITIDPSLLGNIHIAGQATNSWMNTATFLGAWDLIIKTGTYSISGTTSS